MDNIRLALSSFLAHPLRAGLTLLGIVIGTATVVAMMSLIEGFREQVAAQMSQLGADSFQVTRRMMGGRFDEKKLAKRPPFRLSDREAVLARCPSVLAVAGEDFEGGQKVATRERETRPNVSIWAVTSNYLETNGVTVARGRSFTEQEDQDEKRVAVLGADVAEALFPDTDPVGEEVRIRSRPFRVIGVFARRGAMLGNSQDNDVVVPLQSFWSLFGRGRSIDLSMRAVSPELAARAQDEVIQFLRQHRHVGPNEENNFDLFSNESMTKTFNQLSAVVGAATFAVCLLALLVGGIGILNIMLVSVTERTREIGIRKAIGARRRAILAQFTVESITLALLGGVLGIGLGVGGAKLATFLTRVPTSVPTWAVVAAVVMSSTVGLVFGIYPAARASRLDPVVAMRAET